MLHCYIVTDMSKVIRLPDILADFLKKYPSVVGKLVSQIEAGELSLNVDVTGCNAVTATNTDIQAMINDAIAPLLARLEALENTPIDERLEALEAIATEKKPLLSVMRDRVIAA